jgi:hypothetical protein
MRLITETFVVCCVNKPNVFRAAHRCQIQLKGADPQIRNVYDGNMGLSNAWSGRLLRLRSACWSGVVCVRLILHILTVISGIFT